MHEYKMGHIKQIKNEMVEGELMKRKVQADQEAERKRQIELAEQKRLQREAFKKENEDL